MKKLYLFFIFLLFSCGEFDNSSPDKPLPEVPKRTLGLDVIALQHPLFNVKDLIDLLPKGWAISFLDGTFSEDLTNVRDLSESGKVSSIQIDILNGPGLRNKNAAPYEITRNMSEAEFERKILEEDFHLLGYFQHRVFLYKELAKDFPDITFYISPVLEHGLSENAVKILISKVKYVWPEVSVIDNPVNGLGISFEGSIREAHGAAPEFKAEVSSLDGQSIYDIDVASWLKRTENNKITYGWDWTFNCRKDRGFKDPRSRTDCASRAKIKEVIDLMLTNLPSEEGSLN